MNRESVRFRNLTGEKYCGEDGCRQTKGYIEDGRLVCRAGHIHPEWQQAEANDAVENSQGRSVRIKKPKKQGWQRTTLKGIEALHLFLKCYQQLLQQQCHALVHDKGFPQDVEAVVKELWKLRLQLIEKEVASKFVAAEGSETEDSHAPAPIYSSQSEDEDDSTSLPQKTSRRLPSSTDSLGLLYLGCMILNQPLGLAELERWAVMEDIPFVMGVQYIPVETYSRIPTIYRKLLEAKTPLIEGKLDDTVRELACLYYSNFKLQLPELNWLPLLLSHLKALALPLAVYRIVHSICYSSSITFSFPTERKRSVTGLPETKLLSLVIVASKLLFPFNPKTQYGVHSLADPGSINISWSVWSEAQRLKTQSLEERKPFVRGSESLAEPNDVFYFTKEEMDRWMDWYAKTWLATDEEVDRTRATHPGMPQGLIEMFPLPQPSAGRQETRVETQEKAKERDIKQHEADVKALAMVMKALQPRTLISDSTALLNVGEKYEVFGRPQQLQGYAKELYTLAARQGSISVATLVDSVRAIEIEIGPWSKYKDRKH